MRVWFDIVFDEGLVYVKNGKVKKRKKEREKGSSFCGWKGILMIRIMVFIFVEGMFFWGVGEWRFKIKIGCMLGLE